jgi:uncharacterized protein YecT (DUF1311 family)
MILLALTLVAAQPADCRNAMTQLDIDSCAAEQARAAEADMNRVAAQLMRELQARDRATPGRAGQERLRAAQRTWIDFREAQCRLAGLQAMDGSLEAALVTSCMRDMTERRANELRMMLSGR